jgi:hypothetical protein
LAERDEAIERRGLTLVEQAIEHNQPWVGQLGPSPSDNPTRIAWMRQLVTIAAYRERWSISGDTVIGRLTDASSIEQLGQYKRSAAALEKALALAHGKHAAVTAETPDIRIGVEPRKGVAR